MEREGTAMPAHDCGGLYDLDTPGPACPHAGEQHPHESVSATQVRPFRCGPLEDGELVSEGQNLGFKLRPRMHTGANGCEERHQNGEHDGHHISPGSPIPNGIRGTEFPIATPGSATTSPREILRISLSEVPLGQQVGGHRPQHDARTDPA